MVDKFEVELEGKKFFVYDDADGVSVAPVNGVDLGALALGQMFDSLSEFSVRTIAIEIMKGKQVA